MNILDLIRIQASLLVNHKSDDLNPKTKFKILADESIYNEIHREIINCANELGWSVDSHSPSSFIGEESKFKVIVIPFLGKFELVKINDFFGYKIELEVINEHL